MTDKTKKTKIKKVEDLEMTLWSTPFEEDKKAAERAAVQTVVGLTGLMMCVTLFSGFTTSKEKDFFLLHLAKGFFPAFAALELLMAVLKSYDAYKSSDRKITKWTLAAIAVAKAAIVTTVVVMFAALGASCNATGMFGTKRAATGTVSVVCIMSLRLS